MKLDLEVLSAGRVAVGARAWGHRGRARVTVVVKASFRLAPERPLELTAPTPLVEREVPRTENPVTSVRRAAETALYLRRAEILLDAVAFAPEGAEVTQAKARVALARGRNLLLSKELLVVGDRKAGGDPRPAPFRELPITYERAFGGLGHPENPAGVGFEPRAGGAMPNILASEGARVEPFGFGPISTTWPRRRAKRGAMDRKRVDEAPWAELPDAFDDTYFHSAPLDQQLDDLAAGDLLLLAGMNREFPALRVALPALRAAAIAEIPSGQRASIAMRLDTLFVEPHLLRADLIFRGVLEVGLVDLQSLRIAGALEEPGQPFRFPDLARLREGAKRIAWSDADDAAAGAALNHAHGSTFVLHSAPSGSALPFTSSPPPSGPGTASDAPSAPGTTSSAPPPGGATGRRSSTRMPAIRPAALVSSQVVPVTPAIKSTLAIEDPEPAPPRRALSSPAPGTPSAPAPPAQSAPPPAEPAIPRAPAPAPWDVNEPIPAAPTPAPPPRPILPQGPDRKAQLYRKFKA
ncbi:MAG: DUF2169 domain-containing protein [Polyangiaceae bacterium]